MMTAKNEQHEGKEFLYNLDNCCQIVAEKYGNADISAWINRDYLLLSSRLFKQTNVQISASTLKRIFGKLKTTERYFPQKATRDALAQFAGFEDWEDFVQKHPKFSEKEDVKKEQPAIKIAEPSDTKKAAVKKKYWQPAVLIALAAAAIVLWEFFKKENIAPANTEDIKLICKNAIGQNPHTADFIIQIPEKFSGDTAGFKVDFDDGRIEKKELPETLFTYYYEIPGRYYAVLKYNDIAIDTVAVYLKSNGWTATATMMHDTTRVYPVKGNLFKNAELKVNTDELFHAGIDTNRTFFVHFVNSNPLDISGDNFELTANVTASKLRPGVRCSQVNIDVYGDKSHHSIMVIKPGCVSWASLRFSEIFVDGKSSDLSSVGTDLSHGGKIRLRVENKNVDLFVNDNLVYKTSYHFPLKKIYGVKVVFSGIGTLHNLVIKDLKTGKLFNDGFQASSF